MQVVRRLVPPHLGCAYLSAGNFDGVHRGHRRLLQQTVSRARAVGAPSVVLSFEPHPASFFAGKDEASHLLCSREQQRELLAELGVELLWLVPFDEELAKLSPVDFVERYLVTALGVHHIVVGDNFRFGAERSGGAELLRACGRRSAFSIETMVPVMHEGERVSSSRIRQALLGSRLREVEDLLGRPFCLRGTVVGGDKRGRELGFPTANLSTPAQLLPADGIYVTCLNLLDQQRRLPAVSSVGTRPTYYADAERIVESHVLTSSAHRSDDETPPATLDLYGERVEVEFVEVLRPQRRYDSGAELRIAIAEDVEHARALHQQRGSYVGA